MAEEVKEVATTETPNVETKAEVETPVEMETGGATDSGGKLGMVAIMMLGLTTASLIYSIYYYRKRLEALKKGDSEIVVQLKKDMEELKGKINTLTGNTIRNGKLVQ
jgi:hypothetical protein